MRNKWIVFILYTNKYDILKSFYLDSLNKINDSENETLIQPFAVDEIKEAIKQIISTNWWDGLGAKWAVPLKEGVAADMVNFFI